MPLPTSSHDVPTTRTRNLASLLYRLDAHRRVVEHRSPLSIAEGRLLWLLTGRPRTLREISDELELEQSTVNRQVNGAIAAGLLRRIVEPGRSARLIAPTGEGAAAYEAATALAFASYADGLRALGADADRFLDLLDQFVDAYGDDGPAQP